MAKFSKDYLLACIYGDQPDDFERVVIRDGGHTRWNSLHTLSFTFEGKRYHVDYSQGATEQQDETPFMYEGDIVECAEITPSREYSIALELQNSVNPHLASLAAEVVRLTEAYEY